MSYGERTEVARKPEGFTCSAFDNPLQACDQDTPRRPASEVKAQAKLDGMNLPQKAALTPEQSDTLRNVEAAILHGDVKTVENTLQKYRDNPDAAQPFMDALVKDLRDAGIYTFYDVGELPDVPGKTGMFSMSTSTSFKEDLRTDHKQMCIYTNPSQPTWADLDSPRSDEVVAVPADQTLKEVGAKVIKNLTGITTAK